MVVLLTIGGKCSPLGAKAGHISGHLPIILADNQMPVGSAIEGLLYTHKSVKRAPIEYFPNAGRQASDSNLDS
jgi:hypothetical protein